jgi:hypothetical protein
MADTREITIDVIQQTDKAFKFWLMPDFSSVGDEILLNKKYEYTYNVDGTIDDTEDNKIELSVKPSGSIRWTYYFPTENTSIKSKDKVLIAPGAPTTFSAIVAAGGEYRQPVYDYVDEKISELGGDMASSVYDPQGIEDDVFARANHTGAQAQSTVTNLVSDLAGKASTVHTHDDRYFTETESDARYAAISHAHAGVYEPSNANIQSHISSTANPHNVTKAQVGLGNVPNTDATTTANVTDSNDKRFVTEADKTKLGNLSGTNSGDETASSIKSKLGISTLSGSNTGDQDLSGYALTSAVNSALAAKLSNQTGIALLSSTTVNTNVDTKQSLFIVPAGKKCIVFAIVLRNASASLAAIGDEAVVGFDEFASDVTNISSGTLASLTGSNQAIARSITGLIPLGGASNALGIVFLDTSVIATVTVDIFGYLADDE